MLNREEFTKAVNRYINNGWLILATQTDKNDNVTIEFVQIDDKNIATKMLELSMLQGVRIKSTDTNWKYTEWNSYNSLTACL